MENKILKQYLKFTEDTESPTQYHRWAFISIHAAALGRNVWLNHGPWRVYPNMYIILSGISAARKSAALSIAQSIMKNAKYSHFVPTRTSREQFLEDFTLGFSTVNTDESDDLTNLLRRAPEPENLLCSEAYICSSEFLDFIGIKNHSFINTLTNLWDSAQSVYSERYRNRKLIINNPVVNLIGGMTPTNFGMAMPLEVTEQGLLSRLLLVHSDPSGRKITFPTIPTPEQQSIFIDHIRKVRAMRGEFTLTENAAYALDDIYQHFQVLNDARLQSYCGRRLDHLFKLCIVLAAMRGVTVVCADIVEEANTILTYTESSMSAGLGEFGESKYSKVSQKIVDMLASSNGPLSFTALWTSVSSELDKILTMNEIMQNLERAQKITLSIFDGEQHALLVKRNTDTKILYNDPERWL